jgi:hypothetical protein
LDKINNAQREETIMSKHDEARRAFLIGAAVGAGAVAGKGLVADALAQTHTQHGPAGATTAHAHGPAHGAFLNDDDAATVSKEAFTRAPIIGLQAQAPIRRG